MCLCLPHFLGQIVCILTCGNSFFNLSFLFFLFSPFNLKVLLFYMWPPPLLTLTLWESPTFSLSWLCFLSLGISFITSTIQAYKTNLWTCQASISHFLSVSQCVWERGKKKQRLIINRGGSCAWQGGTERALSFSFCFRLSKFLFYLIFFCLIFF